MFEGLLIYKPSVIVKCSGISEGNVLTAQTTPSG